MSENFKALVWGDTAAQQKLSQIIHVAQRPRLAMRNVAAVLENETSINFEQQGRPKKWKGLEPATEFKRIGGAKGYTKSGKLRKRSKRILAELKILIDSGNLEGSVESRHGDDYAVVGTAAAIPYARIHQLGGKAGKGRKVTIPARPYLPFTPDFKLQAGMDKVILDAATDAIKNEAGL